MERITFNSEREALRELYEAVQEYGATQGSDPAEDERSRMFDVMYAVGRFLRETEVQGNESD